MKYAAYIALGSNVGNKFQNLKNAVCMLSEKGLDIVLKSDVYRTAPYGHVQQDDFLNAVIGVVTDMSPLLLLNLLKECETELGREKGERWGPRTIDLDIILFGEEVVISEKLKIPHEDFRSRDFVLRPLYDIGKMMTDPITGKTVRELYEELEKDSCVKINGKL